MFYRLVQTCSAAVPLILFSLHVLQLMGPTSMIYAFQFVCFDVIPLFRDRQINDGL